MFAYRYRVAAIYAAVLFLDRLDLTIVNITLPTIAKYFGIPVTQTEWINTAYLLSLVASIPISSFLGERFGFKRVFNLAIILFGLSSFCCAYSDNLLSISLFRLLQGIGGGLIVPIGMSLVYQAFDKSEYVSITSFIFMPTLIAPALAPFLGGLITELYGWQWVFLFVAPICILASIATLLVIKEPIVSGKAKLDWRGFVFSILSLTTSFYFLSMLGHANLDLISIIAFFIALISGYCFYKHQKVTNHPIIHFEYLRNKLFLQANLIQVSFQLCHYGAIFLVSTYLQVCAHMSAKLTGLVMGMQAIGSFSVNRFAVMLFHRFSPKAPLAIGLTGIGIITPCIMFITNSDMLFVGIAILYFRGIFSGLCGATIQTLGILGFANDQISRAGTIYSVVRQISMALGIALSSVLINLGVNFIYHSQETTSFVMLNRAVFFPAFFFIPFICFWGIFVTLKIDSFQVKKYQQSDTL